MGQITFYGISPRLPYPKTVSHSRCHYSPRNSIIR